MNNIIENFSEKVLTFILIEGILFLLLGILDLVLPVFSTLALSMLISVIFIILGIAKFVNAVASFKYLHHVFLDMGIGILAIVIGSYLFMHPALNLMLLTIMVALYFILESASSFSFAIQVKNIFKYWWVNFFAAAIQLGLGVYIIAALPESSLWVLGILVGVSLVFTGVSLITIYSTSLGVKNTLRK
ncbi:MAG: DUF308 domain-containing protein [Candidatus Gastranaerophilales bacterium]|nr:DUF308 domain-containing protein [Candidatus Gastranaerophilales bacterium]